VGRKKNDPSKTKVEQTSVENRRTKKRKKGPATHQKIDVTPGKNALEQGQAVGEPWTPGKRELPVSFVRQLCTKWWTKLTDSGGDRDSGKRQEA